MGLPTAILFDLDDTLISAHLHPRKAWTKALQTLDGGLPEAPSAEDAAVAIHGAARWYWSDAERHRIGRLDILTARKTILTKAFAEMGWREDADLIDRLGRHFTDQRSRDTKLFPDAVETLEGLAGRGVRLGLITNGNAVEQRAKVDRFDLARHFVHVQIEGEVGFGKPEERAYAHALENLGTSVEETWIIGDNLDWEVVVPQRLGFYSIWRDPIGKGLPAESEAKPDRIVTRLTELLEA
ncbi:MAG: HAD family hydrolase [Thalassobaculum sp.]